MFVKLAEDFFQRFLNNINENIETTAKSETFRSEQRTWMSHRWGMPIISVSTPVWMTVSMTIFIAGINISHPSTPKRLSVVHFVPKNFSKLWRRQFAFLIWYFFVLSCSNQSFNCTMNFSVWQLGPRWIFKTFSNPITLLAIVDVHIFNTNRSTVNRLSIEETWHLSITSNIKIFNYARISYWCKR